jgi:DNA-binding NarL/FixJ family response regulator
MTGLKTSLVECRPCSPSPASRRLSLERIWRPDRNQLREVDMLAALKQGISYPQIAESLNLKISTVYAHSQKIYT